MITDPETPEGDEGYFEGEDESKSPPQSFDANLLEEPLSRLPTRRPIVFPTSATVRDAMRHMQRQQRGCVLITEDGTPGSRLIGIFTERDVLYRVVDRGRNPAVLPLSEVMTPDPEAVPNEASIAWVLNQMAVGGFRHIPVVDEAQRPVCVISVRDIVEFLVEFFPRQILNLPPEYRARMRGREGA
jgi:CBS domain-containing protein